MPDGETVSREWVSDLLASWAEGEPPSEDRLFSALYQELRRLARHQLRGSRGRVTLDTTGLIHEAYLKMVEGSETKVRDRGHFLALSSRVMRQIVVDQVRRKNAGKRGDAGPLPADLTVPLDMSHEELLTLDEALGRLESLEPRAARLVDLRFFGGFSVEETAEILEVSISTVRRDWERARAFLYNELKRHPLV